MRTGNIVTYQNIAAPVMSFEQVKHGDEEALLGKNVIFYDGDICPPQIKCDWCDGLVCRIMSRSSPNYTKRIAAAWEATK